MLTALWPEMPAHSGPAAEKAPPWLVIMTVRVAVLNQLLGMLPTGPEDADLKHCAELAVLVSIIALRENKTTI